ncbi:hypothetical protein JTE90_012827 [Oedothorax gibbosus]|uniref:Centromere protein M n=1 Tax=Oedothorax gibbosus TaxID=931172 RepID=A0AAV6W2R1_9ARAC|nr:hypothetical protein JTE90_012827 [Oedothorax gibbosus]
MSQPLSIVKPLYNDNKEALTFLIVCESDTERKSLGEAMNGCKGKPYQIHVLTRKCLPLSKTWQQENVHFDFIVFVIDSKEKSLKNITDSLRFVDVEYFPGKCCFLMLNDNNENNLAPEIQKLVNFYATEALCANFSNENEIQDMVSQILIKAELSCGLDCFVQT